MTHVNANGYLSRVYAFDSVWLCGRRNRFWDGHASKAAHFRLATEQERHLDRDFDESRLPDSNEQKTKP